MIGSLWAPFTVLGPRARGIAGAADDVKVQRPLNTKQVIQRRPAKLRQEIVFRRGFMYFSELKVRQNWRLQAKLHAWT